MPRLPSRASVKMKPGSQAELTLLMVPQLNQRLPKGVGFSTLPGLPGFLFFRCWELNPGHARQVLCHQDTPCPCWSFSLHETQAGPELAGILSPASSFQARPYRA